MVSHPADSPETYLCAFFLSLSFFTVSVLNLVRGKETPLDTYHSGIQNEVGSLSIGQQQILENVMWLHSFNKKNRAVIPIKFINVDCYSLIKPELSN